MDLSAAVNRVVVPASEAIRMRWHGERGHYEVYYLTLNHLPSGIGLWLRYTLDAREGGGGVCELWGHAFEPSAPDRSFGHKQSLPLERLDRPPAGILRIGDALLAPQSAAGALGSGERALSWNLTLAPSNRAVYMAPYPLRALGLTSTNMMLVHADARFYGSATVAGRELTFDGAPGTMAHLWGKKHAERWMWGHCNAFAGRSDCSLDAVAIWLKRCGALRGPLTSAFLRYRERDYCLNALPALFLNRSRAEFPRWSFAGRGNGLRFVGTFRANPARMLQVIYEDPDGEKSYCANTEMADFSLEVWKGRRQVDALVSEGTAHFEHGDRSPVPGVRAVE